MGKVGLVAVVLALLATARCYSADLAGALAGVPIVGPMVSPPASTPGYVSNIGKPATATLPETDFSKWFTLDAPDPYDVTLWTSIESFLANTTTQAGWTEACKKVSAAAGSGRSANPPLGALACSGDGTVTQLQGFAAKLLAAQAMVALWLKGAPGASTGAIQARQGAIRLACAVDVVARQGGSGSAFAQACAKALGVAYLSGDGATTFTALGEAYRLVAGEIARLDPTIDPEPGYFGGETKP